MLVLRDAVIEDEFKLFIRLDNGFRKRVIKAKDDYDAFEIIKDYVKGIILYDLNQNGTYQSPEEKEKHLSLLSVYTKFADKLSEHFKKVILIEIFKRENVLKNNFTDKQRYYYVIYKIEDDLQKILLPHYKILEMELNLDVNSSSLES